MGPDNREARQPDEIISPEEAQRRFEAQVGDASGKYNERVGKAKKGLVRRLLSPGVIAKTIGMGALDTHGIFTGYTLADVIAVVNGSLDIIAAKNQTNRDPEERDKLRLKGVANIVAGAVPFVPASATTPAINAAIDVERNPK